jgi:hypothetical protein
MLSSYLFNQSSQIEVIDPIGVLEVNDPVFARSADGQWHQVGFIESASFVEHATRKLRVQWYDSSIDPAMCRWEQFHSTGRLDEVVRLLLPPEKRTRIERRLRSALQAHDAEISQGIGPLVQQSLRESLPLLEAGIRESLQRHSSEVHAVGERINRDVVQGRLIPLAKEDLLQIVRLHVEQPVESIGQELWDRASIWRFGWRALYDWTPLPDRSLLRQEWLRFVEEEATEVIEDHMDELTVAIQRILADVANDPKVRAELAAAAETVANDPETRMLVKVVLKEGLVENEALRRRWTEIWTSAQAQQALDLASQRLEPVIRSIGDDLFGSTDGGIDPDFARVLRNQILGKDRSWIVIRPNETPHDGIVRISEEPAVFPIIHLVRPDETTKELR